MKQYTEPLASSEPIRELYASSVENAAELLYKWAENKRMSELSPEAMAKNKEALREEYAHLLGIDVCREVFGIGAPSCEISFVGEDELTKIERLKLEIAKDVYFTGLLFTPHKREEKAPILVFSHGGGGSPELCSDMVGPNNYGGVLRKLLGEGAVIFAPQLLLWNLSPKLCESDVPYYCAKYDRAATDNKMKHSGASISGFQIYCISRSLDFLLDLDWIDSEKCGMLGLSYGGFFTHYTMAYDTRIKFGWAAAFYNDRRLYNWSDVVWQGSAQRFFDSEVTGLCAPRRLIIDIGKADSVFDWHGGESLESRTREFYRALSAEDNLHFNIWDGGHKFCPESYTEFLKFLNA